MFVNFLLINFRLQITIASLQNLLLEKDTTLSRYQDLLKTERMEHNKSCAEYQTEIDNVKCRNDELNRKIQERDVHLEELKRKLSEIKEGQPEAEVEKGSREMHDDDDPEMSFNLLDSNRIDDIYVNESREFELAEKQMELQELKGRLVVTEEEIQKLQRQLIEVSKRECGWESALAEKDIEIERLKERFLNDKVEGGSRAGNTIFDGNLEDLKEMLEEKDRHIHDLTKTLTHFHVSKIMRRISYFCLLNTLLFFQDDHQNYLKDTTLSSAEDMARMSSDLSRTEASNKVLTTQIEALKRQMMNLEQREKQAREMVKTLKQQLMKRPVISVSKTMHKEDQYQRKIDSMQGELNVTKEELRKQTQLAEQRRMKGQSELQLWEKQKRAQQSAEKLKLRLAEREQELEKVKCQLGAARQLVSRMERERQLIEGRQRNNSGSHSCQSPSCPNDRGKCKEMPRRPVETPETEGDEEEDEERDQVEGYYGEIVGVTTVPRHQQQNLQERNNEAIKALKARVEVQQRKIVAMELEGKGGGLMAQEVERMQEKIAGLESQNLRLEARNLQLQLESDLLRKGDEGERQQRQIKHLEDYVLVLKEELSQAVAVNVAGQQLVVGNKGKEGGGNSGGMKSTANMEQTILALKRIVERLRVENRALKEGKGNVGSGGGGVCVQKLQLELKRVQDLYAEALNKIAANETARNCNADGTPRSGTGRGELKATLVKLEQKTQLLEKAKLLLTRAAAKEKNLREQIEAWKRKCSELQNVPVIDEISE